LVCIGLRLFHGYQLFIRHPTPFIRHPTPFIRRTSPFIRRTSPFIRRTSPFIRRPTFTESFFIVHSFHQRK